MAWLVEQALYYMHFEIQDKESTSPLKHSLEPIEQINGQKRHKCAGNLPPPKKNLNLIQLLYTSKQNEPIKPKTIFQQ